MSSFEIVFFTFFSILGALALKWANTYGKRRKLFFEKKAISDLEEKLADINSDIVSYSFFCHEKNLITPNSTRKTGIEKLRESLVQDVTKCTVGNGAIYLDPEYDLVVNSRRKEVHYSVGRSRVNVENALSNT